MPLSVSLYPAFNTKKKNPSGFFLILISLNPVNVPPSYPLNPKTMSLLFSHALPPSLPPLSGHRNALVFATISTQKRKSSSRRKKRQPQQNKDEGNATLSSSNGSTALSALEKSLRLTFMEELMQKARSRDTVGVSDVIYDMIAAGLTPGPRSFHGLVVAHVLNGDVEGAVNVLSFP